MEPKLWKSYRREHPRLPGMEQGCNRPSQVNVSLSEGKKTALLRAARVECGKPLDMRVVDASNPYMSPMGATFEEFAKQTVR